MCVYHGRFAVVCVHYKPTVKRGTMLYTISFFLFVFSPILFVGSNT